MRVVAILGPTASGKSALSIALAHALDAEVVNCDSMQLYRGMDIGTAKLRPAERDGVPHHLLDIWPVTQPASVAEYQVLARAAIDGILDQGRTAVLVGGSGLYVRAVLEEFHFPGTDQSLRESLEAQLAQVGAAAMHERLQQADPQAAALILPTNGRRIVRALEVIELTGRPFTAALPEQRRPFYEAVQIAIDRPDLDARIARRVEHMWELGFVDEVRALEKVGLRDGLTASRALGYQQILGLLAGECTEQEAFDATVTGTRRFVRRQRSWFRRDPSVLWLDGTSPDLIDEALGAIKS
ncbi:tRNA (adenosine(37)-N6)-dimethylallyltransferase MiaA [Allorhizocola rhizosphaerae]|uniref:tRNA (adenosine(37)-N6)-dimethylallyltransferase MiaA n=1 Tax=Allorhizocola rhizosphaerae TaxID=1872709 RepID=UPI000E3BA52D|nr:tRNA (adenosine(37)-N6)-dimethylallyltransferase MiaA [Allorhizocola rhizosphaerae]